MFGMPEANANLGTLLNVDTNDIRNVGSRGFAGEK